VLCKWPTFSSKILIVSKYKENISFQVNLFTSIAFFLTQQSNLKERAQLNEPIYQSDPKYLQNS